MAYSSSGRDRGRNNQMYDAVCDNCGKNCKVPFRPSGGKPVLCSECYEEQGGSRPAFKGKFDRNGNRDRNYKGGFSKRTESGDTLNEINMKLTHIERKLDELLERM